VEARVNRLRMLTLQSPGRIKQTVEEIRAIFTAIMDRDPDAAEAACRRHIEAAAEIALAALTE
jgi:DNA-binding GntR family transcriptional regulator